jgi:hypothetical protein
MRPIATAVATLAVVLGVTLVSFRELVRHPTGVLVGPQRAGWNDLTAYFVPLHEYPRQCLAEYGQWPLWNPFRNTGTPHLGNPQAALFYPPNWLFWWAGAARTLSWLLVLHHLLAGVGTYLLCRKYLFGWPASVTAGSVFLAAPYLIAQTGEGHYAQTCAVAWMPWALLAFESFRQARWSAIGPMAGSLAFGFLAGHIQEWFYLGLILSAWAIVEVAQRFWSGAKAVACKLLCGWLFVSLLTFGLVAVDLTQVTVYAGESARSIGLTADEAGTIGLSWCNLFQLLNAFALGGPDSYSGKDKFFWETLCSFGIGPFVLAIVGVLASWSRYAVRCMACTGVLALLFGFGSGSPVFHLLYWLVPGLEHFRAPGRVMFFCSLAVAVLAAAGIDWLLKRGGEFERRRRTVRRIMLGLCLTATIAMLATKVFAAWGRGVPSESHEPSTQSHVTDAGASTPSHSYASVLIRAMRRSVGSGTSYAWLLGVCTLTYAAAWRERLARPAVCGIWLLSVIQLSHYAGKMLAVLPASQLNALGSERPVAIDERGSYRVLAPNDYWPAHRSQSAQIFRLQGYEPVPLARHLQFMTALTGRDDPTSVLFGESSPEPAKLREGLLDLANVQYVIQSAHRSGDVPADFNWRVIRQENVVPLQRRSQDEGDSYVVFENSNAMPRAFVVGQTQVWDKQSDPAKALADLRPREEVLMSVEFLPPGRRAEFAEARVVEHTPNRVVVEADLPAVGYLVLTDTWYPGWTATANGQPTSVIPANVAFRAVPLSAGQHRVVFQYEPRGFGFAATITIVSWLIVGAIGVISRFRAFPRSDRGG